MDHMDLDRVTCHLEAARPLFDEITLQPGMAQPTDAMHWTAAAHRSHRTIPRDQWRQRQVTPALVVRRFHVHEYLLQDAGIRAPGAGGLRGI